MTYSALRLHASVTWQIKDKFLEVASSVLGKKLKIQVADTEQVRLLFSALFDPDGAARANNIIAKDKDGSLASIVRALAARGMAIPRKEVDPSFNIPMDNLSDRQVRFFNAFETEGFSGVDYIERLRTKKVVIFGLGGFGSWIVLLCDRIGIGSLVGVDFDHVELSNLPRQVLFGRRHIGMKKIDACRDALIESGLGTRFVGVNLEVESIEEAKRIIEGADFVFVPFGHTPGIKIHNHVSGYVAKACTELGVPYIFVGANMVGPLWVPNKGIPCYFCLLDELNQIEGIDPANRSPLIAKRAFAPSIADACSRAVWEAAGHLTGAYTPFSLGKVLGNNWMRGHESFTLERKGQSGRCEICHHLS